MSPDSVTRRLEKLEAQVAGDGGRGGRGRGRGKGDDRPSPREFIESLSIEDRATGALVPFKLWESQVDMLEALAGSDRLVVLKARQLGASWLALAYLWYLATFERGLFLVARQSLEESAEAIHRLKVLRDSTPERWRCGLTVSNVQSVALSNGSRIRALSSAKAIGRGLASRYALLDELAFWADPEIQFAALEPGAEKLAVVSTGAGPHDFFHGLWTQAVAGQSRWAARFYPWTAHPGRDEAWHIENVDLAPSPTLAAREYAACEADAFLSPAGQFFERFAERNIADVEVCRDWRTVRGLDWGYHSPAAIWLQQSPSGQPFVIHEHLPHDLVTAEFVAGILREDERLGLDGLIDCSYVDPAGSQTNVQTQTPEVEAALRAGLAPVYRHSLVREGATRMRDAIADEAIPLVVSRSCPRLIEALQTVRVDKNDEHAYAKDGYTEHVLDALRYVLLHLNTAPPDDWDPGPPTWGPSSGLWNRIW